jgi:hypothetical protein
MVVLKRNYLSKKQTKMNWCQKIAEGIGTSCNNCALACKQCDKK